MANLLDESAGPINPFGRDVNVINRQVQVQVGIGSMLFQIALWVVFPIIGLVLGILLEEPANFIVIGGGVLAGIITGLIWQYSKTKALNHLRQLEQKIQAEASTIDNYLEQRVVVLTNLASLVSRAINLDRQVMENVAALRSGIDPRYNREAYSNRVDALSRGLSFQVEAYPDLKAHQAINQAIQQNNYLQREITAARQVYNDRVYQWNREIFDWPTKMIVAASQGFTTRIPFTASAEVKAQARNVFF